MRNKTTQEEKKAWENLKLTDEIDHWKIFKEKGNGRVWARRKESLTTVIPNLEEKGKNKKKIVNF